MGGFPWNGNVSELIAWTNCFSRGVLQQIEKGMMVRHGLVAARQLLFAGDSILYGIEGGISNLQWNLTQTLGTNFPYSIGTEGMAGFALSSMTYGSAFDLNPVLQPIVVIEGGVNDLPSVNSAVIFQSFTNVCNFYRTNGAAKIVYVTPMPQNGSSSFTATETNRQAYLSLIAASWPAYCDAVVDWGNNPVMGSTNNIFNTNFFPSESGTNIHPSALGYQLLASSLANAIQSVAGGVGGLFNGAGFAAAGYTAPPSLPIPNPFVVNNLFATNRAESTFAVVDMTSTSESTLGTNNVIMNQSGTQTYYNGNSDIHAFYSGGNPSAPPRDWPSTCAAPAKPQPLTLTGTSPSASAATARTSPTSPPPTLAAPSRLPC